MCLLLKVSPFISLMGSYMGSFEMFHSECYVQKEKPVLRTSLKKKPRSNDRRNTKNDLYLPFSCPILFSSLLKHFPLIKYCGVWSLHVVFIFTLRPVRESGVRSHSEGDGVVTTMRDFSREAVCLMEPLAPVSFLPFQGSLHGHIGSSARSIPHCQHLLWGQFRLSCPFDTWLSMVVRADPSSS